MNEMENVIQIVSSLIPNVGQIDEIEYLPGGYNNDNFRVTIKDEIFVVRVVRDPRPRPFERQRPGLPLAGVAAPPVGA